MTSVYPMDMKYDDDDVLTAEDRKVLADQLYVAILTGNTGQGRGDLAFHIKDASNNHADEGDDVISIRGRKPKEDQVPFGMQQEKKRLAAFFKNALERVLFVPTNRFGGWDYATYCGILQWVVALKKEGKVKSVADLAALLLGPKAGKKFMRLVKARNSAETVRMLYEQRDQSHQGGRVLLKVITELEGVEQRPITKDMILGKQPKVKDVRLNADGHQVEFVVRQEGRNPIKGKLGHLAHVRPSDVGQVGYGRTDQDVREEDKDDRVARNGWRWVDGKPQYQGYVIRYLRDKRNNAEDNIVRDAKGRKVLDISFKEGPRPGFPYTQAYKGSGYYEEDSFLSKCLKDFQQDMADRAAAIRTCLNGKYYVYYLSYTHIPTGRVFTFWSPMILADLTDKSSAEIMDRLKAANEARAKVRVDLPMGIEPKQEESKKEQVKLDLRQVDTSSRKIAER